MVLKTDEPYTVEAVVRKAISNSLVGLHTAHPCKVKKVLSNGTVDVDLMIHSVFKDGTDSSLPSITQLPVLFQGSSKFNISFPIEVGDEGIALFAERDISNFIENGRTGRPNALRVHDLSDGMFLPAPISSARRVTSTPGTLTLLNEGNGIEITSSGIKLIGDVEVEGKINSTGDIESDGEVAANAGNAATRVSVSGHTHLDSLGSPTNKPTIPEPP